MKTTLFLCVLAVNAFAAQPVLTRISPEALARLQQKDPMIHLVKPAKGEATVARPIDQSIIKQSTIIHDAENWTLVPNGAVVCLPLALKARVNAAPSGTLISWTEFLTRNRGWITTHEVTIDQASGKEPLPAERAAFWAKQNKIVIAVHQNGPISVRVPDKSNSIAKQ